MSVHIFRFLVRIGFSGPVFYRSSLVFRLQSQILIYSGTEVSLWPWKPCHCCSPNPKKDKWYVGRIFT